MAEQQAEVGSAAQAGIEATEQKTVLVCLGEHRRAVTFTSNGRKGDAKALLEAAGRVFSDILDLQDDKQVLLQTQSHIWSGKFVDIGEDNIEDKAKIRAVLTEACTVGSSLGKADASTREKSTSSGLSVLQKLKRPPASHAKILATMFPSTGPLKRPCAVFDPTAECVAAAAKRKKKAFRGKPSTISVVLLPTFKRNIPKGKRRDDLRKAGRIQTIVFQRSMSPQQVTCAIQQGFKPLSVQKWAYLKCGQDGLLDRASSQEFNGADVVSRKGSLYLCQDEDTKGEGVHDVEATKDMNMSPEDEVIDLRKPSPESVAIPVPSESEEEEFLNLPEVEIPNHCSEQPKVSTSDERILESRRIRDEQDEAFAAIQTMDQEKEAQVRTVEERKEKFRRLRVGLRAKYAATAVPKEAVRVTFRTPGVSTAKTYHFSRQAPTKELYEYVVCTYGCDDTFGIYKTVPRELIPIDDNLTMVQAGVEGVLAVEENNECPDVLASLAAEELLEMSENFTDVVQKANQDREAFMERCCIPNRQLFTVRRESLFEDTIKLYQDKSEDILGAFPLRISFEGERAIDTGGVSRDFFTGFWELAYQRMFDGGSLLSPFIHADTEIAQLPLLGTILSHSFLAYGFLPVRIAFPSLAGILKGPNISVPHSILAETFIDSLSSVESSVVKQAVNGAKLGQGSFCPSLTASLVGIFSRFGARRVPTPETLTHLMVQAAQFEFLIKPHAALTAMHHGIPVKHAPFWQSKSAYELFSLFSALTATPAKVMEMLQDNEPGNPGQARVLGYLFQYIGNMNFDELRSFLRFVTGSGVCLDRSITVTFNNLSGLARRPIAHTCDCTLELSVDYRTSLEFIAEFQHILQSDYAWDMHAV